MGNFKNIKRKSILFFGVFLLLSAQIFSQTAKALGEYVPTPEEIAEDKRKRKLEDEIFKNEKELKKVIAVHGLHYASATPTHVSEFDKKEKLQKLLKRNEDVYRKTTDARIISKCNLIAGKYRQLGRETGNPCSWLTKIRKASKENIEKAKTGIANIGKKKKKIKSKVNKINQDINELDNILSDIDNASRKNKNTIKEYNKKNKDKSIDDFLKTNPKAKKKRKGKVDDFLSVSNTKKKKKKKKGNDFLSGISKPPEFSDSDASKGYKIDYKQNGTYGVIDIAGNILIPYKKWFIRDYKEGIAKVDIRIDSYNNSCSRNAYGSISASANKTGFVDNSTNFIDGYKITFSGSFSNRYTGLILQKGTDNRSYAEKQASKRRYEKKRKLARRKCEAEFDEWKTQILNRYK